MTGVTSNGALSVEAASVQIEDHLDHATRSEFGLLVVFIEAVGGVAIIAANAKRAGDEGHRRIDLRGGKCFEDLDVLELLLGGLRVRSGNNADEKNEND